MSFQECEELKTKLEGIYRVVPWTEKELRNFSKKKYPHFTDEAIDEVIEYVVDNTVQDKLFGDKSMKGKAMELIKTFHIKSDKANRTCYVYDDYHYRFIKDEELEMILIKHFSDTDQCVNIVKLIVAMADDIDDDENIKYISMDNGLVDIETKKLISHNPDCFTTIRIHANYLDNPNPVKFLHAMGEWLPNQKNRDVAMKSIYECFMPRACIKIFYLVGKGGNGKSTFRYYINELLGNKLVVRTSITDLIEKEFAKESLVGKFACLSAELPRGYIKETRVLKELTGEDKISVRMMYVGNADVPNTCTMIVDGNQLPKFDDNSQAMLDRRQVIPFEQRFRLTEESQETPLQRAKIILDGEKDEVISYILQHDCDSIPWISETDTEKAWAKYGNSIDRFLIDEIKFLDDTSNLTNKEKSVPKGKIIKAYEDWCRSEKNTPEKFEVLKNELEKAGTPWTRFDYGMGFDGIQLREHKQTALLKEEF